MIDMLNIMPPLKEAVNAIERENTPDEIIEMLFDDHSRLFAEYRPNLDGELQSVLTELSSSAALVLQDTLDTMFLVFMLERYKNHIKI